MSKLVMVWLKWTLSQQRFGNKPATPLIIKKNSHFCGARSARRLSCSLVAFPKKRRGGGGQTAGNAQGRQRSARQAKGAKASKGRQSLPMLSFAPNASLCFPMPALGLSLQMPAPAPATPCQARPPKNQDSFSIPIPIPFYMVCPIGHRLNMLASLASGLVVVVVCERERAPFLFTSVVCCLHL